MNERHDRLLPDDEKGVAIMNPTELWSTFARRFAMRVIVVAALAITGCATERPTALAPTQRDGGDPTARRTSSTPDDTIDPATRKCEAFGCES
jgi:hypothetical protein